VAIARKNLVKVMILLRTCVPIVIKLRPTSWSWREFEVSISRCSVALVGSLAYLVALAKRRTYHTSQQS
jgi:hypothetical protein